MNLGEYLADPAPKGERNHDLYCAVLQAREEGWSESEIRERIANKAQSIDHLPTREVRSTINSALRAPITEKPKRRQKGDGHALDWDAVIGVDKPEPMETAPDIPGPADDWEQTDLPRFLEAVFEPDDKVIIVANTFDAGDGKRSPGRGLYVWTARELIEEAREKPNATEVVYSKDAGAWTCLCPGDGKGRRLENIVGYRHALVEFDDVPLAVQWKFMTELRVPCSSVVHSGGKSLHFAVRVDADNAAEYAKRVRELYGILERHGHTPDRQNKNPNRLCRLPGVWRGNQPQYLVSTHIGLDTWAEWRDYIDRLEERSTLPPIVTLRQMKACPPPQKDEVIQGIVRRGHKLLLSSSSKGFKTWTLIHLACAVSQGKPWHDYDTARGKVLYLNFELQAGSMFERIKMVESIVGADEDNFECWNLRGYAAPLDQLTPTLLRHVEKNRFSLIILDPLYKTLTGDENSAYDMSQFTNYLERLAFNLDATIAVAGHFSKGKQGQKAAIDRTSGSGVFGRDPDAIAILTPLDKIDGAVELEWITRDFPKPDSIRLKWECPLFRVAPELAHHKVAGASGRPKKAITQSLYEAITFCGQGGFQAPIVDVAATLGISERTLRRRITAEAHAVIENKTVVWQPQEETNEPGNQGTSGEGTADAGPAQPETD